MNPATRLLFVLVSGLALLAVAPAAHAADDAAAVTIVHAVPGLTVDVYVDGALTLPGFTPGTITDPLALAPGTYAIAITAAGGDPATPVIVGSATVAAGDDVSLVAHLAADSTPTLSAFANDLRLAGRGQGRLIVRHVAAAPAVDVEVARRIWRWTRHVGSLQGLTNGEQDQVDVRAARYEATILPAGSGDAVAGPARVRVRRDEATIVYAIGDLAAGTFRLLVDARDLRSETATAYVVHGVPGLTVDVYVNGTLTLPSFEPRTITDPLTLPCGTYDVVIVAAGGDPATPVIQASVTLASNSNISIVAHLAADGRPTASVFDNDTAAAGWRGRVVVRHAAAAPGVDARLTRWWHWWRWNAGVLAGLENGQQADAELHPGRYTARVTPAGQPMATVLGPAALTVRARRATIIYAIGSLAGGTLDLLVQSIRLR